eukprot:CAMPEP_0171121196 /NCGR_PEP_ID=MMETSP0766_2-20121228/101787_1 /TAXON_ID=439317 /ORGANISM="Gambierdiscus australes, Strain CAWD 149" /LENGTH=296 /DNA_ID=CAMNT_0011583965 /DNA_START=142 /DNA_END=1032 /DNA_ORIENTATION=+
MVPELPNLESLREPAPVVTSAECSEGARFANADSRQDFRKDGKLLGSVVEEVMELRTQIDKERHQRRSEVASLRRELEAVKQRVDKERQVIAGELAAVGSELDAVREKNLRVGDLGCEMVLQRAEVSSMKQEFWRSLRHVKDEASERAAAEARPTEDEAKRATKLAQMLERQLAKVQAALCLQLTELQERVMAMEELKQSQLPGAPSATADSAEVAPSDGFRAADSAGALQPSTLSLSTSHGSCKSLAERALRAVEAASALPSAPQPSISPASSNHCSRKSLGESSRDVPSSVGPN